MRGGVKETVGSSAKSRSLASLVMTNGAGSVFVHSNRLRRRLVFRIAPQFVVGFDDAAADFGGHLRVLRLGIGTERRRVDRIEEAHFQIGQAAKFLAARPGFDGNPPVRRARLDTAYESRGWPHPS